jgi:hypothetical protein
MVFNEIIRAFLIMFLNRELKGSEVLKYNEIAA